VAERLYDIFEPATVPATTTLMKVVIRLQNNFPFALRQLQFVGFTNSTIRIRRVDGSYIQSAGVQQGTMFTVAQARVNFEPIQPQEIYPPHGAIEVDLTNPNLVADTQRIFLRGVQFVPDDQEFRYVWPPEFRQTKFDYVTRDTIQNIQTLRNRQMLVEKDADFALLGLTSAQDNNQDTPTDLRYQLKSEWGWNYSNVPIDRLHLIGNFVPAWPRPAVPPIFIPRSSAIYYDMVRNDPLGAQAQLVTRWIGYKITEVCA